MKTYIVRATAQIQLMAETDKPEELKELVEGALVDVYDIITDITGLSIEEVSKSGE